MDNKYGYTEAEFEQIKTTITMALLREYRWHEHDYWADDDDIKDMWAQGVIPWPHLANVAGVAADAILSSRNYLRPPPSMN